MGNGWGRGGAQHEEEEEDEILFAAGNGVGRARSGVAGGQARSYLQPFKIYKLGFYQNYCAFALILLTKIVLGFSMKQVYKL